MILTPKFILFPHRIYHMVLHIVRIQYLLLINWIYNKLTARKEDTSEGLETKKYKDRVFLGWFLGCATILLDQWKLQLSFKCLLCLLICLRAGQFAWDVCLRSFSHPRPALQLGDYYTNDYLEWYEIFWEHLIKHILCLLCWNHCKVFYLLLLQMSLLQN